MLQAQPTDSAGKKSLADECKSRAKGSLGSKNYPEAIALYAKAIEIMNGEEGHNDYVAILHANTSMCQLGMDKAVDAAASAEKAMELDPVYVKAYYRAGAAYQKLKKFEDAKAVLLKGLEKKPDDKDMIKMMDAVQKAIVNGESIPTSKPASKPAAKSTYTAATTTAAKSSSPAKKASSVVLDKDEDEGVIRGYKKTSDGRTTSYFNNEMDEATKALIGDITPQAISSSSAAPTEAAAPGGVSAWNSAGTFESKQMTPWAKQRITELVKELDVVGAADGVTITVKNVELEGDAEIVSARGKRKVIYDFIATLTWELSFGDDDSTATGTMKVADIEADEGDYEVTEIAVTGSTTKEGTDMIRKYIRSSAACGQQKASFSAFDQYREEIKAK